MATYPRLTYGAYENNKNGNSSLFLYNANYIRLKNLEVGYSLPKNIIRFAGLQNVRFYVQGLNLLTFDSLDDVDMDPETKEGSGDWYPIQRVYNFGVEITYLLFKSFENEITKINHRNWSITPVSFIL